MRRYAVEVTAEAAVKYYYIMNNDTLEVEILPNRYLTHKTRSNRSPNTVKRSAYSLCYYMEYMAGKEMELLKLYELTYEEQNILLKKKILEYHKVLLKILMDCIHVLKE